MQFTNIRSIKSVKSQPVYHLTVEGNHNFFGNNLCLHNCDYYENEKNDGHIMVKLRNPSDIPLVIKNGEAMVQGIFMQYLTTEDDASTVGGTRTSGIGSTTKS